MYHCFKPETENPLSHLEKYGIIFRACMAYFVTDVVFQKGDNKKLVQNIVYRILIYL